MVRPFHLFSKYILTPVSRSVRKKLLLILLSLSIVPLLIITSLSYVKSQSALEQMLLSQNNTQMDWVRECVNNELDRIDEVLTAFYFDSDINFYINKIDTSGTLGVLSASFFRNKIKSYLLANYQDFNRASLYLPDVLKVYRFSLPEGLVTESLPPSFMEQEPLLKAGQDLIFSDYTYEQSQLLVQSDGPYILKFYRRFEDRKILAVLIVQLKWKIFDDTISLLSDHKGSQIYLARENGQIIYGQFSHYLEAPELKQIMHDASGLEGNQALVQDRHYIFSRQLDEDIWLIKMVPTNNILDTLRGLLSFNLTLIILTALAISVLVTYVGYRITRPITHLAWSMYNIDYFLNSDVVQLTPQVRSKDEIKILEQSYLMMIDKIRTLIDQEYRQKIETQAAQLMALQAQINPHFLYNTLQMIGAMAVERGAGDVYHIISSFVAMMRYNMQMKDQATLQQELAHLDAYLAIQQHRFTGKLIIHRQFDPAANACQVPRLILQPVVENCFKHGFATVRAPWTIWIASELSADDQVMIWIADNGAGIEHVRLREIHQFLNESFRLQSDAQESLGIRNIHARLKLYFGPDATLMINNRDEGGTEVILKFPMKTRAKKEQGITGEGSHDSGDFD